MIQLGCALIILVAGLLISTPAPTYFNIWRVEKIEQPINSQLEKIRDAGCGNPEFAIEKFGETAFMRGELSGQGLSVDFRRALAAANIAEDYNTARIVLRDYLLSGDSRIVSIAQLQLAWTLLRNASDVRQAIPEARKILEKVQLKEAEADTHYLLAVLAFHSGRDGEARKSAAKALSINPDYYNARVLFTILALKHIKRDVFDHLSCAASIASLKDAIIPVLKLGACPVHVAHLELSIRRFLGEAPKGGGQEFDYIRQIILAYVSRNDDLRKKLYEQYGDLDPRYKRCYKEVNRSSFGRR